jgi:hypothetical protein
MRLPADVTNFLFEHETFHVCHLLTGSDFERFCRDRNLSAPIQRLEKLERLRLLLPVLRIYRPDVVRKIELVDEGRRYRDLGGLKEGEVWTGDTQTELAQFGVDNECYASWREHGVGWDPRNACVDTSSRLSAPERHVAYYSQFQIHRLQRLLNLLTLHVEMEWAVEDDGLTPSVPKRDTQQWMANTVRDFVAQSQQDRSDDLLGILCQVISDRYYPHTQTDERRFTLSISGRWDWYEYVRKWDANAIVEAFDIQADELNNLYDHMAIDQNHADPIAAWYPLARFVSLDKRKRLKGDALRALTLREMALMLRLFYRDAFGQELPEPHEVGRTIYHRIPDIDAKRDPLRALELTANDFHVNPKPQLVLFVEGHTEAEVIPVVLDRLYGVTVSVLGIEIVHLGGIGNVAGGKENPFSALWRLIDYLHHHQTIAVVLADNEGFAKRNLRSGLPKAVSTYLADRRVTRAEYVKVWRTCFEFDNFNNAEIARALTELGGVPFSKAEVDTCRRNTRQLPTGKTVLTLERLYASRTKHDLDKPALGLKLVAQMCDPRCDRLAVKRPLGRFLTKVVELASRNHQPSTHEQWMYNQRTGYLGTLRPGAVAKRKPLFGRKRRK